MEFVCCPAGDKAVLVEFRQEVSEEVNRQVISFSRMLKEGKVPGIQEWVPAYASILIYYDPMKIGYYDLINKLKNVNLSLTQADEGLAKVYDIPVLYGGKWGQDLEDVARFHSLTVEEVIQIHSKPAYRVYMLGFAPGFPYLGGLDERIHTPRLQSPRLQIPAGSVGIAGQQTGVYPLATPGGWRIIGHTPIPLFRPDQDDQPFLISAGDFIRFVPVTEEQYEQIKNEDHF